MKSYLKYIKIIACYPFKTARRALALIVLMVSLSISTFFLSDYLHIQGNTTPRENWIEYVSNTGGFSVALPTTPDLQVHIYPINMRPGSLKLHRCVSECVRDMKMEISYVDIPSMWKLAGHHKLLNQALDLIAEERSGIIVSKQYSKFHHHKAMDFEMDFEGGKMQGKVFLKGSRLFLLAASDEGQGKYEEDISIFFESFTAKV